MLQSDDAPAFSMGCGTYGREYRTSGTEHIMPTSGVVPVYIVVHATVASGSYTLRLYVTDWSYVDVAIVNGTNTATAHLVCGSHPQEDVRCWPLVLTGSEGNAAISFVGVYYLSRTSDDTT